ncbi:MAG: chemotaxis protein CheW [Spongiibacteraceae bacterium]|nr:chemotaxis protein CheW [Spongiibacteraceae bacterium]
MAEAAKVDDTVDEAQDSNQYLTFKLSGETYGMNILDIKEIIEYGNLTPVPMMPKFIAGVINLRGSVVPVVNLNIRFGGDASEIGKRTSIVIIEVDNNDRKTEIGIIVDIVNEVIELTESDIEPPPSFGARIRADFIKGMGKIDEQFLILLDVEHVLSIEELSIIEQTREETPVEITNKD